MGIGELAEKTGVSTRSLRYYEEQGLLTPARDHRGYRKYTAGAIMRVNRIQQLFKAGLNSETIKEILPCTLDDGSPSGVADQQLENDLMRVREQRLHEISHLESSLETLDEVIRKARLG